MAMRPPVRANRNYEHELVLNKETLSLYYSKKAFILAMNRFRISNNRTEEESL